MFKYKVNSSSPVNENLIYAEYYTFLINHPLDDASYIEVYH